MKEQNKNYMTVSQFADHCKGAWPATEGAIRAIILEANRGNNNFQSAFIKVGRRVLVDVEDFWRCVTGMRGFKK